MENIFTESWIHVSLNVDYLPINKRTYYIPVILKMKGMMLSTSAIYEIIRKEKSRTTRQKHTDGIAEIPQNRGDIRYTGRPSCQSLSQIHWIGKRKGQLKHYALTMSVLNRNDTTNCPINYRVNYKNNQLIFLGRIQIQIRRNLVTSVLYAIHGSWQKNVQRDGAIWYPFTRSSSPCYCVPQTLNFQCYLVMKHFVGILASCHSDSEMFVYTRVVHTPCTSVLVL